MQTEIETPVREKKQVARQAILERSIDLDQEAILERWAQTFIHDGKKTDPEYKAHRLATNIMMVAMAAVAKGHFEVSASGENSEF